MMGQLLYGAHVVIQRIGQWFADAEDDAAVRRIRSREAYARWQAQVRADKAAARAKHGRIREIERRQTETLHAALAANRQHGA